MRNPHWSGASPNLTFCKTASTYTQGRNKPADHPEPEKSRKRTLNQEKKKKWGSKAKIITQGRNRGKGICFKKHKPTNILIPKEEKEAPAADALLPEPTRAQAQEQQQQRHTTTPRRQLHDEYRAAASTKGWTPRLTTWRWRAGRGRAGTGAEPGRRGGAGAWAGLGRVERLATSRAPSAQLAH